MVAMNTSSVEILSVNEFIDWSANIFESFGAYFGLFFFGGGLLLVNFCVR